jgi:uncharacterized protein
MEKYTAYLEIAKNYLVTLTHLLDKAEEHVKAKGIDEKELLDAQLAPDMFPFAKQIRMATDDARRNLLLLTGKEHIPFEDKETTIAELKDRVKRTQDIVNGIDPAGFEGADERKISLYWMGEQYVLGKDFVVENAIPNFLFHVVTAYSILRMKGLQIGKSDYMRKLSMRSK